MTQDRLAERPFAERAGAEVAPWREVRGAAELARGGASPGCRSD